MSEPIDLDLEALMALVDEAGAATLEYFGDDVDAGVEHKADASPLTLADRASHEVLVGGLPGLLDLPVLSEETEPGEYADRQSWSRFWLVDPLDGTKEFVKGRDEFTVNVALIDGHRPVLGVVGAPVKGTLWAGRKGQGAFRRDRDGARHPLTTRGPTDVANMTVAMSASHASEELKAYLAANPGIQLKSMGSSLKFCLVAEGVADVYPRKGPTMEWDTAAAHAVVEAAGGVVLSLETGEPLEYNKASLKNPGFMTLGDPGFDWRGWVASYEAGA